MQDVSALLYVSHLKCTHDSTLQTFSWTVTQILANEPSHDNAGEILLYRVERKKSYLRVAKFIKTCFGAV